MLGLILGNGYVQMGGRYIGNLERSYLDISLSFATRNDGLILWQGDQNDDFIRAGIKDGYLEFAAFYDDGKSLMVRSSKRLNDASDHRIKIILQAQNVTLEVDDRKDGFAEDLGLTNILDVGDFSLFLGGHEDDIADVTDYVFTQGFRGCIKSIGILHFKIPGTAGPLKYGLANIPLNQDRYVIDRNNMECVKMCRV